MGIGKNIIDVILRLVDQLSPGYKKAVDDVKQGSDQMTKGNKEVADASGKAAEATTKVGDAAKEAAKQKREAAKEAEQLRQGYQQLAVVATGVLVAMTMAVTAGIAANNKQIAAFTGLKSVVIGTGKSYDEASSFVKNFTEDGLISQMKAAEALKNLLQRGFSLDEAIQMLDRLKDAASFGRQAHLDMGQAVASATEGLRNEMSILVDNAGVTKNVSIMWKEYAAELGKGVQSLTLAEKRQAEFNGVMNETRHQVGDASKMASTFAGEQAKAGKATMEASAALGRAWSGALKEVLPLVTGLLTGVKALIDRFPGLTVAIMATVGGVMALVAAVGLFVTVWTPAVATAMGALAVKAGIMWAAITGPIGLAIIGLAAVAAAVHALATAKERAAEAAVEHARKEEQAAKEIADTTRNKVKEILRQEEQFQDQLTELEREAADQRAEIAKKERADRREEANQLGGLILSALRQRHQEEKAAEEKRLDESLDSDKRMQDKLLEQAKEKREKDVDAAKERLKTDRELIQDRLDAEREGLRDQHELNADALRDQKEILRSRQSADKEALKDRLDVEREGLRDQHELYVEAWQERKNELRSQQSAEKDAVRDHHTDLRDTAREGYEQQNDELRTWAREQEKVIRDLHRAQIDILDAETDAAVKVKQDEINAIDGMTRSEDRAEKRQRDEARVAELQAKVLTVTNAKDKASILADIAELEAKMSRDLLLEQRDAQKVALRAEIEEIRQSAKDRKTIIQEAQQTELEALGETVVAKRKILEAELKEEIKRIAGLEKTKLASLELVHKDQIKTIDLDKKALDAKLKEDLTRVGEREKAELASLQVFHNNELSVAEDVKKLLDAKLKDDLGRIDKREKAELKAADKVFNDLVAFLAKELKAKEANHKTAMDVLDARQEEEKAKIQEKYAGLLSEANLHAEAIKLVQDNNQQEILALLDTYEPDWKNQGKDFVQRLAEGGEEAKPAVEALVDSIATMLQAATENVLVLHDKAGDGAAKLAETMDQVAKAKAALGDLQTVKEAAEDDARVAAENLKKAEEERKKAEVEREAVPDAPKIPTSEAAGRQKYQGGGYKPQNPRESALEDYNKYLEGSRHGGGDVPFSGMYRLLQGEQVLSRSERERYERLTRLVDASTVLPSDPARALAGGGGLGSTGLPPITFDFRGSAITNEEDAERYMRRASQRMLGLIRQNTAPVR